MLAPELENRSKSTKEADKTSVQQKSTDALSWFTEIPSPEKIKFDPLYGRLDLKFVANHTTSSTLTHVMFDLVARQHPMEELRKKIIKALGPKVEDDGGWKKSNLYKLALMDSLPRESQRRNPMSLLQMIRKVLEDVTLSDGKIISAGVIACVPSGALRNPAFFDSPDQFDGHRFMHLRVQSRNENSCQRVTTSQGMSAANTLVWPFLRQQ